MQTHLTKLASALILSSSLVGCAALVKSPYEQPNIATPSSFQNSKIVSKQIHADAYADQWWTLFNDVQLKQSNLKANKVFALGMLVLLPNTALA